MQVQMPRDDWKIQCLAQWDRECLESNGFTNWKKFSQDDMETLDASRTSQNEKKHIVSPGDTLEGLSLIYEVPIETIKEKNGLHSNEIYYIKELTIPNAKWIVKTYKESSQEEKIQQVMAKLKLDSSHSKLVRRILAQSRWNVEKTVEKYWADLEWEKIHSGILEMFVRPLPKNGHI